MMAAINDLTVQQWLDALANATPTPGGGAAAALGGALGAALVSMVAHFTIGRTRYTNVQEKIEHMLTTSTKLRTTLTELVQADAIAYDSVATAYRLPKSDGIARTNAIQTALITATEVPLQIAEAARQVLLLAQSIAQIGNRTLATDAGGAALLAQAAIRAALLNVTANCATLQDETRRDTFLARAQAASADIDDLTAKTLTTVNDLIILQKD
jgi:formiminotetrahydrofolate cyclodeaminase